MATSQYPLNGKNNPETKVHTSTNPAFRVYPNAYANLCTNYRLSTNIAINRARCHPILIHPESEVVAMSVVCFKNVTAFYILSCVTSILSVTINYKLILTFLRQARKVVGSLFHSHLFGQLCSLSGYNPLDNTK